MQLIIDDQGRPLPNILTPIPFEKITGSGTNLESSVINATKPVAVRIYASADCHYLIGVTPTATTSSNPLPAKQGERIKIPTGHKISVLITGDFYIAELT